MLKKLYYKIKKFKFKLVIKLKVKYGKTRKQL